jgi:hypothetical protein
MERVKLKKAKKKCPIRIINFTMNRLCILENTRSKLNGTSDRCSGLKRMLKSPRPMSIAVEARKLEARQLADLWDLCLLLLAEYPLNENKKDRRGNLLSAELLRDHMEGSKPKICTKCNQAKDYLSEFKWIKPKNYIPETHIEDSDILTYHYTKTQTCNRCLEMGRNAAALRRQKKNN